MNDMFLKFSAPFIKFDEKYICDHDVHHDYDALTTD